MLTNLFRRSLVSPFALKPFCSSKMLSFTDFYSRKLAEESNQQVATGRSWKAEELRLKSSEDLHKLWHLLLIEKNLLLSDNQLKRKIHGTLGAQGRMSKVRVSMSRLLTIVNERKKVQRAYREHLENEYIKTQREAYLAQLKIKQEAPFIPEINEKLLRDKYRDLKRGVYFIMQIDNTDYIQRLVAKQEEKKKLKQQLDQKYDHKKVEKFQNSFEKQLQEGVQKISQQEVLRSHIKNWRSLNLRQRRIILGFINAKYFIYFRRAREAKDVFVKELNLLSQKIAHDKFQNN